MGACLVLGASGQIGRFLVPALLDDGHEVHALSRIARSARHPRLRWLQGDLHASAPDLPDISVVFSLGPLDGLARWLASARLDARARVIAFGSMSVDSKRDSADAGERVLAARLLEAERAVAVVCAAQSRAWTVLRPTLIYGAGLDRSLTPIARLGRRWHVLPALPAASGLRQPVHAADLAEACLALWKRGVGQDRTYALGGGERLAFATMLARLRASLGVPCLGIPLPLRALDVAWPLWGRLRSGGLPGRAALTRLRQDLITDDAEARADFGWSPRGFAPQPGTWDEVPDEY
ncbi:MAG TPA: NAD-dependent epimerase/dehydratase family protein [Dokdonella sp.]|uniref:NAD-dependent epimerase/dehydratase family protein n=1 Tax=Dokdonella sp. TaxID=2291710 RepID=UPI0025B93A1F|nr:NAD-dependent epimerase/dehydratase family protein [Dokdonella sp.]MBX3691103.1 NAD(P)H-binding protein [Dokdonella sp.]MCW5567137.1 NAD(P)H-binding protein [Dokdonella sp.]HNR91783.1 NAD-dependent epimerase/dehydratase family protein [Dokdonella sp.]